MVIINADLKCQWLCLDLRLCLGLCVVPLQSFLPVMTTAMMKNLKVMMGIKASSC
jgi:hypothetical protein